MWAVSWHHWIVWLQATRMICFCCAEGKVISALQFVCCIKILMYLIFQNSTGVQKSNKTHHQFPWNLPSLSRTNQEIKSSLIVLWIPERVALKENSPCPKKGMVSQIKCFLSQVTSENSLIKWSGSLKKFWTWSALKKLPGFLKKSSS